MSDTGRNVLGVLVLRVRVQRATSGLIWHVLSHRSSLVLTPSLLGVPVFAPAGGEQSMDEASCDASETRAKPPLSARRRSQIRLFFCRSADAPTARGEPPQHFPLDIFIALKARAHVRHAVVRVHRR